MEVDENPDELISHSMRKVLISEWAARDPEGALAYVNELDQQAGKDELLMTALKAYGSLNGEAAIAWVKENVPAGGAQQYKICAVFQGMAMMDAASAAQFVEQLPEGSQKGMALSTVMETWAKQDPRAVFAWISKREVSEELYGVYQQAMFAHLKENPDDAVGVIDAMYPSPLKATLSSHYAAQLAKSDTTGALDWASNIEDVDSRRGALMSALGELGAKDPEGAFRYISEMSDDSSQVALMKQVSIQMAEKDPVKFSTMVDQVPASAQGFVGKRIADAWLARDPAAAIDWINQLPNGDLMDGAVRSGVQYYAGSEPDKAFGLAVSASPALRYNLLQDTVKRWGKVDAEAAQNAVASSGQLGQEERGQLLGLISGEGYDVVIPQN